MGYQIFSAGICCGLSALASGLAIGVAGEAGVKAFAQTEDIFVGMILILIFAECIGLYGLIIAIIMIIIIIVCVCICICILPTTTTTTTHRY